MDPASKSVDPITFEILSHKLHQITREMGATLERVGGTVNTTQQRDYMTALYRADGDLLSTGDTFPQHSACAGFAVKRIIERFQKDGGIYPEDIFLLNDPYTAAIHQSDVYTISPIHFDGRLIAWSATFVHVMDIGARSPGGNSPDATEVFHEGLRIPGIKLVERGRLRKDVFDTIINMTRQPGAVGLDLKCEIAANNVAKSRMREVTAHYGAELVEAVFSDMIHYSKSMLSKRIAEIPDGAWSDTVTIQADETWRVVLTLTKRGDRLLFDFTGSDAQSRRGINLPYHATFGGCFSAVLPALGYDIPKNYGACSPIEVTAPQGTVVNVKFPGPVSMNTTSGMFAVQYLAASVLNQMLATSETWRKEVIAPNAGNRTARHAGVNQYGRYYVSGLGSENALSGSGARSYADGIDSGGRTISCPNVEWVEQNFPLRYVFRRHLKDSAGAGKFRGGMGTESALTLHDGPDGKIKCIAMGLAGLRNSGQGIFGGYQAAPSLLILFQDTKLRDFAAQGRLPEDVEELGGQRRLLPYCEVEIRKDDVLYLRTASGGGYGDPLDRDPAMVLNDVLGGVVSERAARDVYGVVLDRRTHGLQVDGTRKVRMALRKDRLSSLLSARHASES